MFYGTNFTSERVKKNKTPSGCNLMAEDQKGTYSTIKSTILGKFSNIKGLTKVIPYLAAYLISLKGKGSTTISFALDL